MVKLRRGFRKEAEEYAAEFREELDLAKHQPLDPLDLAKHLLVPVHTLSEHPSILPEIKMHFARAGNSRFSASTLVDGTYREIIHNDYQAPNRQRSNIMHELSHIILGHPPKPPLLDDSCRNFDPLMEKEASELGFTLLVPKAAALYAIEQFDHLIAAGKFFGVSQDLLRYRIRITNARGWARNRAKKQLIQELS